jgi:tetratricopeptide (TPR) repeat protein
LAEESYHRREYIEALEYARRAEKMGSVRTAIKEIHFKSLVQMEKWPEAEEQLKDITDKGKVQAYYLKGFMLRKKKRYKEAIEAFKSALSVGDHSYPVYRDYADCLYRNEQYDEAFEKINWVLKHDSENIYVLDLIVRIFLDQGLYAKAQEYLDELERFDLDKKFIYHRKARYYSAKKLWDLALNEAEAACNTGYGPFEAYAQRIDILIELNKFPEVQNLLDGMKKKFRNHRQDIQIGLRCKVLIRMGKWQEAKTVWDSLEDKTMPIHKALLKRILELKGKDVSIPLGERDKALLQAEELGDVSIDFRQLEQTESNIDE